jgi:Fic family protein
MRRTYIWQQPDWPKFFWQAQPLLPLMGEARRLQGEFLALVSFLAFKDREAASVAVLTEDAVETSEIEGESLDRAAVRSSVARRLGIREATIGPQDARADGVVEMTVDATGSFLEPLSESRLFRWHRALFPVVPGRLRPDPTGGWRDGSRGPMQVVSGSVGSPMVHFEAPPAENVPKEIASFLKWFESSKPFDWLIASAIAHLWFVTIHPFEDGNGRIARAIADMALSRDEGSSQRYYSMSRQIRTDRKSYYDILEAIQSGDLDITRWIEWYLGCFTRAIRTARVTLEDVLSAARFWHVHGSTALSERQRKVIGRLLDRFSGTLTSRKYAQLAGVSEDTALRDISDLIEKGIFVRNPGGSRNTTYALKALNDG